MKLDRILMGSVFCLLGLTGCQDDLAILPENMQAYTPSVETRTTDDGVTIEELTNVAERNFSATHSRSSEQYTIETVRDQYGQPALYVVNYGTDDGWTIISASKNIEPVLAFAEEGHFSIIESQEVPGLKRWMDGAVLSVVHSDEQHPDTIAKIRDMWLLYTTSASFSSRNPTSLEEEHRASFGDILDYISQSELDELNRMINDSLHVWTTRGWQATPITWDDFDSTDRELYQELSGGGMYSRYIPNICGFTYRVKRTVNTNERNLLVKTTWQQENGYNQSFPPDVPGSRTHAYAGCATIAMGQIMRYHQYPSQFNWSDMPYDRATKTTSDFLLELALRANAVFEYGGTGINYENAMKALRYYGYQTSGPHNRGTTLPSSCPLYYRSDLKTVTGEDTGHAWISGGTGSDKQEIYDEIYTFKGLRNFSRHSSRLISSTDVKYEYMIWGWSANLNGYYYANRITVPGYELAGEVQYFTVTKP